MEAEAEIYPLSRRGFACAVLERVEEESYLQQYAPEIMTMSMAIAIDDPETGAQMEYMYLTKHPTMKKTWTKSCANEFG